MAIVKAIKSGASIKRVINYVTRKDGLDFFKMDGINCNPHTASYEMLYTRDKFSKYDGVQYIHMVYSLSPKESENIEMEQVISNAKRLVEQTNNFNGHQIIICGHDDKKHKHAHIVINSINIETGRKVRWFRTDLRDFKERLVELSKEQGLEIPVKGCGNSLGGNNDKLYKTVERALNHECDSWIVDIYKKIMDAKEFATCREDFIMNLSNVGIITKWDNRQTILFEDEYGHKVRNSRIGEVFKNDLSKEALENEFAVTQQLIEAEREFKNSSDGKTEDVSGFNSRERRVERSVIDDDIQAAIDTISIATTNEQDSAAKRDDKIAERANRENVRKRHYLEAKQRIDKKNERNRIRNRKNTRER